MIFSLFAILVGCMGLLLAMPQYQRHLLAHKLPPTRQYLIRSLSAAMLIAACIPFTFEYGTSIGIIVWIMLLTPVAFIVIMYHAFLNKQAFYILLFCAMLMCIATLLFLTFLES